MMSICRFEITKSKIEKKHLVTFREKIMVIERANKNKLTITLSSSIDSYGLQRLIDYVKYLEATSKVKPNKLRWINSLMK